MDTLWHWLQANAEVLSAVGTALMATVWVVYLQLFYSDQRRRHRPRIEIQQSVQRDPEAPCLLANMSEESIFIVCTVAVIETPSGKETQQLTARRTSDPGWQLRQGPLSPGGIMNLGPLRDMLGDRAAERHDVYSLEVRVVAVHGPTDHYIGASRRYHVARREEDTAFLPIELGTRQLHRRGDRDEVRQWAWDCMELKTPTTAGSPTRDER